MPVAELEKEERWADLLNRVWSHPWLSTRTAVMGLFTAVFAICAARAWLQLIGTQIYSPDAFALLDGAWRMVNGQRPHVDFYTGLGTVAYLPAYIGLLLSHSKAGGFGAGQAVAGFLLAGWAFFLSRRRLTNLCTVLMTLSVVLLATAPFGLGDLPMLMSPDGTYTRYGYALVVIILIEAFADAERAFTFGGGFSTGSAIVLLLFLKISFCLGAVAMLAALLPYRQQTRTRWLGLIAGLFATLFAFAVYFGFDFSPMIQDIKIVGGAKHVDVRWYNVQDIFAGALTVVTFTFLTVAFDGKRFAYIVAAAIVIVVVAGLFVVTGHEPSGFPLAGPLIILAMHRLMRGGTRGRGHAMLTVWGSVLILSALASNGIGFGAILLQKAWIGSAHWQAKHPERFAGTQLSGFLPIGNDLPYLESINEGLNLLEFHRLPQDTVMSLDYANPFSYGLAMKPARGGTTSLQPNITFDNLHKPSPEWLMGGASLVMVPKASSVIDVDAAVNRAYGSFLAGKFHRIGESRNWRLYRAN